MVEQAVQKRIFTHEEFGAFMEKMEEVGGCFEFVDGQVVPKEDDVPLDAAIVEMVLGVFFQRYHALIGRGERKPQRRLCRCRLLIAGIAAK